MGALVGVGWPFVDAENLNQLSQLLRKAKSFYLCFIQVQTNFR